MESFAIKKTLFLKFIILFIILAVIRIPSIIASPDVYDDVLVYGGPGPQNEVSIAVNPLNPDNIVVGFNDYTPGRWVASYAYSVDGGSTWIYGGQIPKGNLAGEPFCDPWLAFDSQGYCYYVGLSNTSRHEVFISVAPPDADGDVGPLGFTDTQIVMNDARKNDKPAIAVDTTGGPYDGNIYVVWARNPEDRSGYEIWYIRGKRDPGTTHITWDWVLPGISPPGQYCQLPQVVVGPAPYGDVYVVYQRQTSPSLDDADAILLSRFFNGGEYYFGSDIGILVASVTSVDFYISPYSWARHACAPTIAVDQTSETLYVVWTDKRYGDDDILMTRSTDLGTTWSDPIRVNQDSVGNGKDQWLPQLILNEGLGTLDVVFYDRRDDSNNNFTMFYLARSYDEGNTFTEFPISDIATDPSTFLEISPTGLVKPWPSGSLGDYVGIDSVGNTTFVCWGDGRNANVNPLDWNSDVYFEKFTEISTFSRPLIVSTIPYVLCYFQPEISEYRSVKLNMTILSVGGFSDTVELSVEGVPLGAYSYFEPTSGVPPFQTMLTIVLEYAEEGTYNLNILAMFGNETLKTPFTLNITSSPYITLGATVANPGATIAFQGYGFTANASYSTYLDGELLKAGKVNQKGTISTYLEIPIDIPDGLHTVLTQDENGIQASATFRTPLEELEGEEGGTFEPASVIPCDQSGNNKTTFLPFEDVYVKGNGYPANMEVTIYILPNGYDANSNNAKTTAYATTGNNGTLDVTLVWQHPLEVGSYDIWVDVNSNGIFDENDVWNNQAVTVFAFNVVPEPPVLVSLLLMFFALATLYVKRQHDFKHKVTSQFR